MSAISGRHGSMEKHLYSHFHFPHSPRASVINQGEDGYLMQPHTRMTFWPQGDFFPRSRALESWRRAKQKKSQLVPEPPAEVKPSWNCFCWETKRHDGTLQCCVKLLLRNYENAMAIIAGKGPIAGYLIPTPIEPAGDNFHWVGQESLNHKEKAGYCSWVVWPQMAGKKKIRSSPWLRLYCACSADCSSYLKIYVTSECRNILSLLFSI